MRWNEWFSIKFLYKILFHLGIETGENDQIRNIKDIKCCTEQIQDLVLARLNTAIVEKLISSVEYLHESFVGTLTRCLKSLEEIDTDSDQSASSALGQVCICNESWWETQNIVKDKF